MAEDTEAAVVGKPAPSFTVTDTKGINHSLGDFKGKFVVLEWFNHECPFVRKHYSKGNMQGLQKEYTAKGVVWLSINSSAQGKQGYLTPEEANAVMAEKGAASTATILDSRGVLGRLYGARTTPHMFVVDPKGMLIYAGAIDDTDSTKPDDIPRSTNYVKQALDEAMAGKQVTNGDTEPYGCSVKYGS
jgi:peroxiredoxin